MNVYLVRHTAVRVAADTCYGQSDVPLAPTFAAEAQQVAQKLPTNFTAVYSSPLGRCVALAQQFTSHPDLDDRLRELNFGDWEQKAWNDIKGPRAEQWFSDFVNIAPPNGESFAQLAGRVLLFWKGIITESTPKADYLIVAHAGVIRATLAHLLPLPLANSFNLTINYGGVTKIVVTPTHTQIDYINR